MRLQNIKIPITVLKEERRFVVYSPALDISTSAPTLKKAQKRFAELVVIFFEELCKMGTVEEVLTELGWKKLHRHYIPPSPIIHTQETFSVPCHA